MYQNLKLKHKDFFTIPRKTFALIGIDPKAEKNGVIIKQPINCFGHYILTFIFALASLDFSLKNFDDINEFTMIISLLNQLIISLWKITIFLAKRRRIQKLIRHIWQCNENGKARSELYFIALIMFESLAKETEFRIIYNISCKCVLMSRLYYMAVGAAAASGVLRPIVIKLLKLWQGVEGDLEVPHKASFLWSTSRPLGYTAAFIWNLITINFLVNASVAIDTLFLWLVANILIRFCILKERFKKAAQQSLHTIMHELIIQNIKSHIQILNLAEELDSIFGEIIFLKSLVSCTQICFLVFRFMGKETSVVTLNYPFVFLAAVVMQLFLYCFSGQLVKEQSLMVSSCIFENFNWSDLPLNCQKMLQMIMLRSQKCSNIKGIFFNLNLRLYLWFFKTAGSLLAVLKTFEADV